MEDLDKKTYKATESKRRILNLYTSGEIERESYVEKSLEVDNDLNKLKAEREELIKKIPLLHKEEVLDTSIRQYCEAARIRFEKCNDFESKRQFLLHYVEKIMYWNTKVELHGSVPVKLKTYEYKLQKTELAKIEFCIRDTINPAERLNRKNRQPDFGVQVTRKEFDELLN